MKIKSIKRENIIVGYLMESPLTGDVYCFYTKESGNETCWTFNNDYENPTFEPSMKNEETGEHFVVTNGKVRYLMDSCCNKTMDMIDID
jgi:hypothetical protein